MSELMEEGQNLIKTQQRGLIGRRFGEVSHIENDRRDALPFLLRLLSE
jgi:hypothetical protein